MKMEKKIPMKLADALAGDFVVAPPRRKVASKVTPRGVFIYLAAPYSHPDRTVMLERFDAINCAAARLILEGHIIFSPISHSHPIAETGIVPAVDWQFWERLDMPFLEASCRLIVLMLGGWDISRGVTAEVARARELGIPVEYLRP
jgi:hypothetical protein